jgi:hypothetical protein
VAERLARGERGGSAWRERERERGNVVDEYGQQTVNSGTTVKGFKKVREVQARLYEQFEYIKNSTRRITTSHTSLKCNFPYFSKM